MDKPIQIRSRQTAALDAARTRALARTPRQSMWHGIIHSIPFMLVLAPFGLLFGVVATSAGFNLAQTTGSSVLVLAGASQFTAVQLITDHAPVWLVITSSLAVNLRMAMYSASIVPWLGEASQMSRAAIAYSLIDQTYVMSFEYFQNTPKLSLRQRLGYFSGTAIGTCGPWIIFSFIGSVTSRVIPTDIPLDFAIPITFISMIAPALRTPAHITAATVSVISSLMLTRLPAGVGTILAALLAMFAGAIVETYIRRRTMHR